MRKFAGFSFLLHDDKRVIYTATITSASLRLRESRIVADLQVVGCAGMQEPALGEETDAANRTAKLGGHAPAPTTSAARIR